MTTFFIRTYGCSHNIADSEQMAGLLRQAKFDPVDIIDDADIIIMNSCTVKTPSEAGFFRRLGQLKQEHPYKTLIITGCIPQTDPEKLKQYSIVGTRNIHHIVEVVEEALNNNIIKALETGEMPPLLLPKIRKNPAIEVIPINRGCLSNCTFCKTKVARGNLQSYAIADIIEVARRGITEGVKEIWLTSQDTFCYGFDIKTDLPTLVKELVAIPGDFRIRIGMGNPVHLKKIKGELFPLLQHEKVFKYMHIPAQSGSNKVLHDMRRGNTAEEFLEAVRELKEIVPTITIATDITVGYPTETEQDYWETMNIVRTVSPDILNISKFWPRSKTDAAELKPLPGEEVKRRSRVLTEIFHNISKLQNERWIGWQGQVIIHEKDQESGQWVGRNDCYKKIMINGNYQPGDILQVKVEKAETFNLRGIAIKTSKTTPVSVKTFAKDPKPS